MLFRNVKRKSENYAGLIFFFVTALLAEARKISIDQMPENAVATINLQELIDSGIVLEEL